MNLEKEEQAKEVAELKVKKVKLQEKMPLMKKSRQEAEKVQKQTGKYQKCMNELAPTVKSMEKLAADFGV